MSAPTFPPPPPAAAAATPGLNVAGTPPVPFLRSVLVEFRKSYNTRAGFWYLFSIALLVAIVETFVLVISIVQDEPSSFEDYAYIAGGLTSLLLPVLAIMLVTSEWSQRSAMVSFSLEPRRSRVVLAKLVVSIAYVVATMLAMLVIAVVATGIAELVQPDLTEWGMDSREMLGFAIFQAITMTIGFAFGALLLNTPAAIVLFFLYWYLLPVVIFFIGGFSDSLGDALGWINFQDAVGPLTEWTMDTAEEWGKLIVSSALWVAVPLFFGITRILRAEVK